MAKITQLPKATVVNDTDIVPIVQDGETKQIPRGLLVPTPPDDLQITNNHLQLTANGETVGNGVDLPQITVDAELSDTSENPVQNKAVKAYIDANPWAKQITYNMTDNHLLVETKQGHINGKLHASMTVTVICADYTRNKTEILSVTPQLSDYRGVTVEADLYNSLITKAVLQEEYVDLSETFEVILEGETMRLHSTDFESSLDSVGAVGFMRTVEGDKAAQTSFSDGLVLLKYTYMYLFNEEDEALRDAALTEFFALLKDNLTRFTVRYAEIPYSKTAEVLNNE